MNTPLARAIAITATISLASLSSVSVAQAKQGADDRSHHRAAQTKSPRVIATKMCGTTATKLKVSAEDAGSQVEYELDQNINGQIWTLTLKKDGTKVGSGKRTTRAPSGSLHWRVTPGGASNGTFTVTAKNGSRTCRISATL